MIDITLTKIRPFWRAVQRFGSNSVSDLVPPYLEGVHVGGRLVAVYSQQNYRDFWSRRIERSATGPEETSGTALRNWAYYVERFNMNSTPGIRLGINIVVYALKQEGSLAQRYVKTR